MNPSFLTRPLPAPLGCLLVCMAAAAAPAMPMDMDHMNMEVAPAAFAEPVQAADLMISAAWARATVPGVAVGAAYFTIENHGKQADMLLGASSPAAANATFHRTTQDNGVAHMRPAGDIVIAAGQTLKLAPTGLHLMLSGLRQPLAAGTRVPVTLSFRRAGKVTVQVAVVPLAAAAPAGARAPEPAMHDHRGP